MVLMTLPVATFLMLGVFLPRVPRYRFIRLWSRLAVWGARVIAGIRDQVEGVQNIHGRPHIIMCKHSSTWETVFLQLVMPPMSFIAKRELVWIPFFGWGFALFSPILIDRARAAEAMQQIIEQGRVRRDQGFWITIFPEGTRIAAGKKGRYKPGGARLALELGMPILPVAHNAGYLWPKHGWRTFPGRITLSVGKPIETAGRTAEDLTREVEHWIESETARLGDPRGLA
jgi:1-acyl-sn-glycerol-3-phosphate acyltransferase